MALKDKFNFDTQKFFLAVLFSFVAIQTILWLLSELDIFPLIKLGWVLLLSLAVVGIVSLLTLGKSLGQLDFKRDMPFIFIVFGGIIVAFIFLPKYIPQIFSMKAIELGELIEETIQAIMKLSPAGIYVG